MKIEEIVHELFTELKNSETLKSPLVILYADTKEDMTDDLKQKLIEEHGFTESPVIPSSFLVSFGDVSKSVILLQAILVYFGFLGSGTDRERCKQIDGIFGAMTEAALKHYQSLHDLMCTGHADAETWTSFFERL